MLELFQTEDGFVSEKEWKERINKLQHWVMSNCGVTTRFELAHALESAVKHRIPKKKFGLMFSGGVDSSILALLLKKENADFICYTVGIEGANDLEWAKKVAKELGLNHKFVVLSLDDVHELMKNLAGIFKGKIEDGNLAVLYGVACVELACINLGREDGVTHFFGGLGSEEIFAGYKRHEDAKSINPECWKGLKNMYARDLTRDILLATHEGITVSTPYLDRGVIHLAMNFHGASKIKDGIKKYLLREVAEEYFKLPKEFAWRKKQAAQYGSKIDKAMEKLTKSNGFKYKKEYLDSL